MQLKYLRVKLFRRLMAPFSARSRRRRMNRFARSLRIRAGQSVLDLGGQPAIWHDLPDRLAITILNLPGIARHVERTHHAITYVEGDACNVTAYGDGSFDIVFSNSVIEHVGDAGKRAEFAREVRRLGKCYWVQTPSKYFPIEAHCGMPFWWFYPASLRAYFLRGWRKKLPDWTTMVEETDVVSRSELRRLFPDASIIVERVLGIPKSYIAYQNGVAVASGVQRT